MLPLEVLVAVPVPFLLALILHVTYYLLPLLHLLPRPGPLLARITALIPNPRRRTRNLPREFFNLPPRSTSPNGSISSITSLTMGSALGVRGKVMLMMAAQAGVSLIAGWVYLTTGVTGRLAGLCLALSVIPVAVGITTITLFSAMRRPHHIARHELSLIRSAIFGSGGVTHSTIIPRILPYSSLASALLCAITVLLPSAGIFLLIITSLLSVSSMALASYSVRSQSRARRGMIRLASPSPDSRSGHRVSMAEKHSQAYQYSDSMISSPSRPPTPHSAFSYSPSVQTPHTQSDSRTPKSEGTGMSEYDTPKTSLTEYTATPETIASWDFTHSPTPSLPTPSSAVTRPRSTSPALPEISSPRAVPRGSAQTASGHSMHTIPLTSTPGSALGSPGGSILAGYSPDPFHPMPRGFESLTQFPMTPSQLARRASLVERQNRSGSAFTFVPSQVQTASGGQGRDSTWTLESYHSLSYQTPKSQVRGRGSDDPRRAPPPPPLPYPMPLPPTPTLSRSQTPWDQSTCGALGKGSTELLMGGEREWDMIDLSDEGEGLESWGNGGRGVGLLSLAGLMICTAFSAPLLAVGLTQTTQILYLISILLPSTLLLFSTYLLRPRPLPLPTQPRNLKKSSKASKASTSTHQSLALKSESQLSLPGTVSPKLTPPVRNRASVPLAEKWNSLLEPKPSISSFGYQPPSASEKKGHRRHTVYGALSARDDASEEYSRKMLARRSVDIWLEAGHAKPAGNVLERAAEMIRPSPALRILEGPPRKEGEGMMRKLRGGVVSMLLPKRFSQIMALQDGVANGMEMSTPRRGRGVSQYDDAEDDEPQSPITIHITSPSKFERRQSGLARYSIGEASDGGDGDGEEAEPEIQVATRARMSASPTYFFGKERTDEGGDGELDWLQSAILPQLMSGNQVSHRIRPSEQFADAESPRTSRLLRRSSIGSAPTQTDHPIPAHTASPNAKSIRRELRHKHSFSLPLIDKASFSDLRSQVRQVGKERQHDWSIYADGYEYEYPRQVIDFSAAPAEEAGVDLPAFPVDYSQAPYPATPGSYLSTVGEGNETRMSTNMRSLAHLTLSAEALWESPSHAYTSPASHTYTSPASQRERLSTDSHLVGQDSFVSDDEAMAREMEQVLAMDTPTRAEFVISPTGSEATTVSARTSWSRMSGGRPLSRASSAGSGWHGVLDKKVSASTIASRRSATRSDESGSSENHTFGRSAPGIAVPPVPELPESMRRPMSQTFAHPFPVHNAAASIPLRTSASTASISTQPVPPHNRPVAPQAPLHTIMPRKSAETIRSEASDQSTPPVKRQPGWRMSRQELRLVKELQERKAAAEQEERERIGRVEKEVAAIETRARVLGIPPGTPPSPEKRKGLKPLRLVANRPASILLAGAGGAKPKMGVEKNQGDVGGLRAGENGTAGSLPPSTPSRKKTSKGGSQKNENLPPVPTPGSRKGGKSSKGSTGVSGMSGIRA